MEKNFPLKKILGSAILMTISAQSMASTIDLTLLETTDTHSYFDNYDYYQDKPSQQFGYALTASLIKKEQASKENTILVDNGDILQGNPMGDYAHFEGIKKEGVHPAYKALNQMGYTVANFGNHDYNFGLQYQKEAIKGANFPYINANVYTDNGHGKPGKPYYKQYLIKTVKVKDENGNVHDLKVGFIGFAPPQIMQWDQKNLKGKVVVRDIVTVAKELVPKMKQQGAELIVAIPHSGLSYEPYHKGLENSVYYLSKVKGIDVILFGHSHGIFPSNDFKNIPGVNLKNGTINGVFATMPGYWGSHLGVVDLKLNEQNGKWTIISGKAQAKPVYNTETHQANVKADPKILAVLQKDHDGTVKYMSQAVGYSNIDLNSYLALIQYSPSIRLINDAAMNYLKPILQSQSSTKNIPLLSAMAPFKAGGRHNDPNGYVNVKQGNLTLKNIADLYVYQNALIALKINGKQLHQWLECAAGQFNQINPNTTKKQNLINWDYRTYNFDVIDGISYKIDVTQKPRYNIECQLINPNSSRVKNLTYHGKPIKDNQEFILATNSYRAFGKSFPGTKTPDIIYQSADTVRDILSQYIKNQSANHQALVSSSKPNWEIMPIKTNTKLHIAYESAATKEAIAYVEKNAQYPMQPMGKNKLGYEVYKVNLQQTS